MNTAKLVRSCVKKFKPYVPGKPIEELKRELKLKKTVKLASNENPLGPSGRAVTAMKKAASAVFLYPDGSSRELREALAKKHRVSVNQVILGSGTDEIIEIIGKTFFKQGDNIVVSKHAFIRYKMAGDLMQIKVKEVPMKNYTHDVERMRKAIDSKTVAVFIANPNNPTGTYIADKELLNFITHVPRRVLIVLDEAYFEYASIYADYPNGISLFLRGFSNIITLRTFSKIYSLAGARIGYGIGDRAVIDPMDRIRPPFNITRLSQAAAIASLRSNELVTQSLAMVSKGKQALYRELDKRLLPYVPSAGNFVLIKVPGSGAAIFKKLLKKGVIIRAMDEYELPDFIRVTIGKPDEMRFFIRALDAVMG
ncbi:MAG: histidinol-phosphate transaminase [bacterium]